jgi:hypothetical protein
MSTEQFPNMSKTVRPTSPSKPEETEEKKPTQKVVSGNVIVKKKAWHKRVLETFVGTGRCTDDAGSVGQYIAQDVIVPAIKDVIVDAFTQAVERMVFGESRGRGTTRRGQSNNGPSFVNYNGMSNNGSRLMQPEARNDISRRSRETHNFGEIYIPTRGEADAVLNDLFACLSQWDAVTVADLYGLVGVSPSFTDHKYGWFGPDGLRGARYDHTRDGFRLHLPAPQPIPA